MEFFRSQPDRQGQRNVPGCASDHRGRRIVLTEPESPITFGRHFVLIAGLKYHTTRVRKAVHAGSMLAGG